IQIVDIDRPFLVARLARRAKGHAGDGQSLDGPALVDYLLDVFRWNETFKYIPADKRSMATFKLFRHSVFLFDGRHVIRSDQRYINAFGLEVIGLGIAAAAVRIPVDLDRYVCRERRQLRAEDECV